MKVLLSICIIITGFLSAAGCIDYPDIVPVVPSDSVPSVPDPSDSVPVPIDSVPVPSDSVPDPSDSVPVPIDSVPVPIDSVPDPSDSVPVPIDSVPDPSDSVPNNGSGTPDLFIIYNEDSNNSHEVDIEIFNSDNESVFKELYIIDKDESIKYPKTSMMIIPDSQLYTFKVVLDNETTDKLETEIDSLTILIFLYQKSPYYGSPEEIIPLEILSTSTI